MHNVPIASLLLGPDAPLVWITGPCVIESEDHTLRCAEALLSLFAEFNLPFIFKASYDKANRSSKDSFRGPGLEKGLAILQRVRNEFGLPILTDVHTPDEARIAGQICDVIQIPAFLCRQTDLLLAAAETPAVINVKKGQFLSPWDMRNAVDKLTSAGKHNLFLTERGTTFGYQNLVTDFRSLPILSSFGYPICFDATHSAQLPGAMGTATGGLREYIPHLTRAAVAVGVQALYLESHPDPANAKSDATTVLPYDMLRAIIRDCLRIADALHPVRH